jgi:hypothetical protein
MKAIIDSMIGYWLLLLALSLGAAALIYHFWLRGVMI